MQLKHIVLILIQFVALFIPYQLTILDIVFVVSGTCCGFTGTQVQELRYSV